MKFSECCEIRPSGKKDSSSRGRLSSPVAFLALNFVKVMIKCCMTKAKYYMF
jgi:hypothetical protein